MPVIRPGVVTLLMVLALGFAGTAQAYYDDVHYALTYYIARQVGYTPLQAERVAKADWSVDYAYQTEPVVSGTTIGFFHAAWATRYAQEPRWRFHAFRNQTEYPDSVGGGAEAADADRRIKETQTALWNQSFEQGNPGVFLHFFEDLVPHGGYGSAWGHWPIATQEVTDAHHRERLPIGGSTDWLSYRSETSNMELVSKTFEALATYLTHISPKQPVRRFNPDDFRAVVAALRRVNPAPTPLRGKPLQVLIQLSLANKVNADTTDMLGYLGNRADLDVQQVQDIRRHLAGPDLPAAIAAINAELAKGRWSADGGVPYETVPPIPAEVDAFEYDSVGKLTSAADDFVLVGKLRLVLRDTAAADSPVGGAELSLRLAPSRFREPVTVLASAQVSSDDTIEFSAIPVGDLQAEIRWPNGVLQTQDIILDSRKTTWVIDVQRVVPAVPGTEQSGAPDERDQPPPGDDDDEQALAELMRQVANALSLIEAERLELLDAVSRLMADRQSLDSTAAMPLPPPLMVALSELEASLQRCQPVAADGLLAASQRDTLRIEQLLMQAQERAKICADADSLVRADDAQAEAERLAERVVRRVPGQAQVQRFTALESEWQHRQTQATLLANVLAAEQALPQSVADFNDDVSRRREALLLAVQRFEAGASREFVERESVPGGRLLSLRRSIEDAQALLADDLPLNWRASESELSALRQRQQQDAAVLSRLSLALQAQRRCWGDLKPTQIEYLDEEAVIANLAIDKLGRGYQELRQVCVARLGGAAGGAAPTPAAPVVAEDRRTPVQLFYLEPRDQPNPKFLIWTYKIVARDGRFGIEDGSGGFYWHRGEHLGQYDSDSAMCAVARGLGLKQIASVLGNGDISCPAAGPTAAPLQRSAATPARTATTTTASAAPSALPAWLDAPTASAESAAGGNAAGNAAANADTEELPNWLSAAAPKPLAEAGSKPLDAAQPWLQPAVQGWMDEWLAQAIPGRMPDGRPLRYSDWGVALSPAARAAGPPDHPSGWTRQRYLWEHRERLPSDNRCHLGEYLRRRQAGLGVADCTTTASTGHPAPQPQPPPAVTPESKPVVTLPPKPVVTPPPQPAAISAAAAAAWTGGWRCEIFLGEANGGWRFSYNATVDRAGRDRQLRLLHPSGEELPARFEPDRVHFSVGQGDTLATIELQRVGDFLRGSQSTRYGSNPVRCERMFGTFVDGKGR